MHKPFEGLLVLDLSRYLLGAYVSLYLADFGARVIKVEDTKAGDYCRQEQPSIHGESYYHYALDRNKESVSFNLKDPDVLEAFYDLVRRADVLIENYRPGVTKRLGIDYDTLKTVNPRLIYLSFSAYGQQDDRSLLALHDINIVAQTGFYDLNEGHVALIPPADMASAMAGIQGVLTALIQRDKTDEGSWVDVSMYDSLIWWNAMLDSRWSFFGHEFPCSKREYPSIGYNIYDTSDGRKVVFGFYENNFWNEFCDDMGRPDLHDTLKSTPQEDPDSYDAVQHIVASKTYDEWIDWLGAHEHPITPIWNKTEALNYAIETKPEIVNYVDFPRMGKTLQTNTPHKIGALQNSLADSIEPELLGESSVRVLSELGRSDELIGSLIEKGAIKQA